MNMYTYIFGKVLSQVIRSLLIGTLPYLLTLAMGYQIVYWRFIVIAYCVDICVGLVNDASKEFAKHIQNKAKQS